MGLSQIASPSRPANRGRKLRIAVVPIVAIIVATAAGGTSAGPRADAQQPPLAGTSAPAAGQLRECRAPLRGVRGKRIRAQSPAPEYLCGSDSGDTFWTFGPDDNAGDDKVRGFGGDDKIHAADGHPDEIKAGAGQNEAWYDVCDRPYNVQKKHQKRGNCPNVVSSSRALAQFPKPATFPFVGAAIECFENRTLPVTHPQRRWMTILQEPIMRAVDATRLVDWQTMAWSPLIYQWNGADWVFVGQNVWLWDRTYDEQVLAFPGNFWRRTDTNVRWFVWFHPPGPGIYRIGVKYHWYRSGKVADHEQLEWARAHYGPNEDSTHTHEWCEFPV